MSSFQRVFARKINDPHEPGWSWIPPAWVGPPRDELGWPVPLSLVVARSDRAVVAVRQASAYSSGVTFDVIALGRGLTQREANRLMHQHHLVPDEEEPSPGFLRFGVELADATRASNLGAPRPQQPDSDQEPEGPVLMHVGGGGGSAGGAGIELDERYWLWPVPPPGPLRIFVEWPALDIELSSVALDAGELVEAAKRSQKLWPE